MTPMEGLTYYSDSEVPGFNITTYNGTITIASNYAINATPETMQEWLVTVTFVNLDSDQQLNTDKSYLGELIVQTDEEFIPGTGSTVSPVLTAVESIQALYTADGENDLYYHDGIGDYGELEAGDNSYRYSGANPRNYVCFGTDTTPCPAENLYRIIGAFDDDNDGVYNLKLIKSMAYVQTIWGSYSVSSSYSWSTTSLNNTLNATFYNSLGEYANNLVNASWKSGVVSEIDTPKLTYQNESGDYIAKIGLMYLSDYGYAANPSYWNTSFENYQSASSTDWLFLSSDEWTITANNLVYIGTSGSSNYAYVYVVGSDGLVSSTKGSQSFVTSSTRIHYYQNINQNYSARPVFYLRSDIGFSGGEGTMENPYTLEMR